MEKGIELIDLSYQPWVFLWDANQEQIINFGQEALDWWQLYRRDAGNEHWQLVYPLKSGILQSQWALEQVLQHNVVLDREHLKKAKRLQIVVTGANTNLEQETIRRSFAQNFLKPVVIVERAAFLNQYLRAKQDFSKLKLIIDLNLDFAELSLFLLDKNLKSKHLPLSENLDEAMLIKRLKAAIDSFILNVPSKLFQEKWQYFYLFVHPQLKSSSILDELSRHLKMEGILNQEQLTAYV
ncbi:MAG TPA: hypothetical protein PKK04_03095 [Candidatus Woesebacteria bacterium]|nr:hypothetical protein [Candidatus Woesebacteria bacterium]HOC07411.1 hypothetical protein [Candidatus Woesebacteria bacterium]